MSSRYLFALVVVLSLFTFACTTSSQADPETLRETELDRKMEAMRIAVQILEGSEICQGGGYAPGGEEFFDKYCLSAIEKAYRFVMETVMQEEQ